MSFADKQTLLKIHLPDVKITSNRLSAINIVKYCSNSAIWG